MKRGNFALILVLVGVALLATSCDTLFTNQFKVLGLGQVASDALSNAVATGGTAGAATVIAESGIGSGTISESFIQAATTDPVTAQKVIDLLTTTAADPASPPATVEAAKVLIVEITLQESGAKTLIDNIINAVATVDLSTFNISNPADLNGLLAALFPPKAIPAGWTQTEIADIIDQVVGMDANFTEIYNGVVANHGGFLNEGVDAGWLAQVDFMITVLRQVSPVNPPYATVGKALAQMINDYPLVLNYNSYISVSTVTIITDIRTNVQLNALFTAAGMDLNTLLDGFKVPQS